MVLGPILHVAITMATKGRYYSPRTPDAERFGSA
jgi:hypothetical protein